MKSSALSLLGAVGSLVLFAALTAQNFSQTSSAGLGDWPMAGANPQRTSWGQATVDSVRGVQWYRPIEAYIDQKTQIIAASRKIYVATTKGLIVLDAETGSGPLWRFDTELPLNTPAVVNGAVYVAGNEHIVLRMHGRRGDRAVVRQRTSELRAKLTVFTCYWVQMTREICPNSCGSLLFLAWNRIQAPDEPQQSLGHLSFLTSSQP
jgi:hypothetical protein